MDKPESVKLREKFAPVFEEEGLSEVFNHLHLNNDEELEEKLSKLGDEKRELAEDLIRQYRSEKSVSLQDVYEAYDRWMEFKDMKRVDVMLAVALSNKATDLEPLWLIIIGPSGDGKTEQIRALRDPLEQTSPPEAYTKRISEITQNTLVSGKKGKETDLAPRLEGKLILIYDFATILNLPTEAKRKVWAQLRELYDGRIGKQAGSGKDVDYKLDPPPSLIACSTPDIDNQIIQQAKLGTRELLYRTGTKTQEEVDKVLDKVLDNHNKMTEMREELKETTRKFLEETEADTEKTVTDKVKQILKVQAKRLAIMRAQGDFDRYTNGLMKNVSVEVPSRLVNQLKTLYICLMSLSYDYSSDRALEVIDKVVESSGEPRREKILEELMNRKETTAYRLSKKLRVSRKMVERDLQVLWNVGILDKEKKERDGNQSSITLWKVNENHELVDVLQDGSLRSEIKEIVKEEDDGDGVKYETLFEKVGQPEEETETVLEDMLESGEVFEPHAGHIKIL